MTSAGNAIVVRAIVACDAKRVIGKDNALPWRLPADMKRFAELTTGHTVLMGRKTYDSLPAKFRPLPHRLNVVCSRKPETVDAADGVLVISSPEDFLRSVQRGEQRLPSNQLWIIGGEEIYRQTLEHCDELYLTLVDGEHDGDAYFPEFNAQFILTEREPHDGYSFCVYRRV